MKNYEKKAQKWTFEKFWTHFGVLHYKQSPEFMIPAFNDYSLEPKITKCGDLLYKKKLAACGFIISYYKIKNFHLLA